MILVHAGQVRNIKSAMERIYNLEFDYVIVLCPERIGVDGKFPEFFQGKFLGGQTRLDSVVRLYERNKNSIFLLVGGYNPDEGFEDFRESQKTIDMEVYLRNKCPSIKTEKANSLPCTKHNLVKVFNTYQENLKNGKVALLTNQYHLSRAKAFWVKLTKEEPEFKDIPVPKFIASENLIGQSQPVRNSIEYVLRIEEEINGVGDIVVGNYQDSCLNKKFELYKKIIFDEYQSLLTRKERDGIISRL